MRPGEVIQDRYRLQESLGRGGMAEVWRADDERLERPVAVKFLAAQLSEDAEFLVRFFSEAQAVARISHPNVIRVLDFGQHDGSPYLVMEHVPGGPLTELTGTPLPPPDAFALVAAVARGVGAAHSVGIVHRDIKPANILRDEDGNPKLADFGIAASARSEKLTATGAAIGSPHYISPEQASGGDCTPASDVYALGIVLYELLTGVRPFEGDNVTAIAIAQVEEDPVPPSHHVLELGPEIDGLVLPCLAKDPADRFQDGNELATALEAFVEGDETVLAAAAVPSARAAASATTGEDVLVTPPWWAGRRGFVAGLLALVAIGLVVAGVTLTGGRETDAVAKEHGPLDDAGGLRIKSPTSDPVGAEVSKPTPTPTPDKKEKKEKPEQKSSDSTDSGSTNDEGNTEPEPKSEPTEEASPAPTGDGGIEPTP